MKILMVTTAISRTIGTYLLRDKSETFTSWHVYHAVFAVCYTRPGLTPSPHTMTNITLNAGT